MWVKHWGRTPSETFWLSLKLPVWPLIAHLTSPCCRSCSRGGTTTSPLSPLCLAYPVLQGGLFLPCLCAVPSTTRGLSFFEVSRNYNKDDTGKIPLTTIFKWRHLSGEESWAFIKLFYPPISILFVQHSFWYLMLTSLRPQGCHHLPQGRFSHLSMAMTKMTIWWTVHWKGLNKAIYCGCNHMNIPQCPWGRAGSPSQPARSVIDSPAVMKNLTIAEASGDGRPFPPGGDRVSQPRHETWGHGDRLLPQPWPARLPPPQRPAWILGADLLHWVLSSTWGQLNLCAGSGFLPVRRKAVLGAFSLFPIFTGRALSLCKLWWISKWCLVFTGYLWSPVFPLVLLDSGDGSHHAWLWMLAMSLTFVKSRPRDRSPQEGPAV